MRKYLRANNYLYSFIGLFLCINLAHAIEYIECKDQNKKTVLLMEKALPNGNEPEEQSDLFNFNNWSNKEKTILEFSGLYGNIFKGMIPVDGSLYVNTSYGMASFIRRWNNNLYYAEGKDCNGTAWQFYDKKYVREHLLKNPDNVFNGQFYPGKRFGPVTSIINSTSTDSVFFVKNSDQGNAFEVSCSKLENKVQIPSLSCLTDSSSDSDSEDVE